MLKGSQGGASALLGFLQSLQQGQAQRSQQRDQYLQQDIQKAEADRAFKMQEDQFALTKRTADAEAERIRLNKPIEDLTRQQQIDAPNQQAFNDWAAGNTAFETARQKATQLRLEASTTRDPRKVAALNSEAESILRNAQTNLDGLKNNIGSRAGVTWMPWNGTAPQFKPGSPASMVGGALSGFGLGGAIAGAASNLQQSPVQQTGAAAGSSPAVNNPTPQQVQSLFAGMFQGKQEPGEMPLTSEELKGLYERLESANLGSLLTPDYYGMPSLGMRKIEDFGTNFGNAYFVNPPAKFGADYNKFISSNEQAIGEAVVEMLNGAETGFIPSRQVLKTMFGKDESLWPVQELPDENGEKAWQPKIGWFAQLPKDKQQRFVGRIQKYIAPSKETMAEVNAAREFAQSGVTSQIANYGEVRKRRWENSDRLFKAGEDAKDRTARSNNVRQPVDPAIAFGYSMIGDARKAAYTNAKSDVDKYATLASGDIKEMDTMARLLDMEPQSLSKVSMKTITNFYAIASSEGEKLISRITGAPGEFTTSRAQRETAAYSTVSTDALRIAGKKVVKDKVAEYKNTRNQADKDKIKNEVEWVAGRAGLPIPSFD